MLVPRTAVLNSSAYVFVILISNRLRDFRCGILLRCWIRSRTPRPSGLDDRLSSLSSGTYFIARASAGTSSSSILVFSRSSRIRSGRQFRCSASSTTPWPSGLSDKLRFFNCGILGKQRATAVASSSPISVLSSSSSIRSGTLCRCSASSMSPRPSGLPDTLIKYFQLLYILK